MAKEGSVYRRPGLHAATHQSPHQTTQKLRSESPFRTKRDACRRQKRCTSTPVVILACVLVLCSASALVTYLLAGHSLRAITYGLFLSTPRGSVLDAIYLADIEYCSDLGNRRNCSSPECSIPWPMECRADPIGRSKSSDHTCGLRCESSRVAAMFRSISDELSDRFSQECHRLVVFSVAFGSSYQTTILEPPVLFNSTTGLGSKLVSSDLHKTHGRCFFSFILASNDTRGTAVQQSADGLDWVVALNPDDLPYSNMRRNTKLVKLHGHMLFPWAERLIWQDAKFRTEGLLHKRPSNYLQWFDRNVKDVCASFYGLPVHAFTVGSHANQPNYKRNEYQHHCETILTSLLKRPDVTDSLGALLHQCRDYLHQPLTTDDFNNNDDLLSLSLIDSAFIGWNLRTPECRNFIADLTCTWADEIQCHSDRDQVSFPHVLRQMKLKVLTSPVDPVHHNIDLGGPASEAAAMVRITQSQCHWYYRELDDCPQHQDSN